MGQHDSSQTGSGEAEGTAAEAAQAAEAATDEPTTETQDEVEIPISMPVPEAELRRLKRAAQKHGETGAEPSPAQSDEEQPQASSGRPDEVQDGG